MEIDFICGKKNIARYMAKYMLKDMDERMWGKRKYFYSLNLDKPQILYLNTSNSIDNLFIDNIFHKFNRESGGEVYFTMPRLQVCGVPSSA